MSGEMCVMKNERKQIPMANVYKGINSVKPTVSFGYQPACR